MSGIITEERERFLEMRIEKQETIQETQLLPPVNENITTYNGRPTLDALWEGKKKSVTVDAAYLMELVEFFEKKTSATVEEFINSRRRHQETDQRNDELRVENANLHQKVKDVIVENTLAYNELDELKSKQSMEGIIKLPLRKVNMFLMLSSESDLRNDNTYFYVKMDKDVMGRISRTKEELV